MKENPTLDAAISLLKQAAHERGSKSVMTIDPAGNVLIMLGADEQDKHGRLQACMIDLSMKDPHL